ncbi:MAG TPA: hypothetical protein PLA43_16490 [Bryobacteraceae bacterium]|nr:hypothetical protein [Bryobacteraceae bacterium]HOQ44819.1 hypothetical protein [Bryobacteraceae bacterium]HPQ16261.1 hypothetical protein [Bryobacteraceae bacterium]HPU73552.1 hypothetical protein [Bryobacteraceae bacterium]
MTLSPQALETYLWWLTILGHLVLYFRLRQGALHRIYRFFAAYLLFRVFRAVLLAAVPPVARLLDSRPDLPFATNAYAWVWVVTQVILWFFYILVVLELYSLVLQNYKGIATLGRWALLGGLVVSLIFSSVTLWTDLSNPGEQFPTLLYLLAIDRGILSSLVVFLLLITGFLVWCPVPLSRNVVVHCIAYAAYFLPLAVAVLLRNVMGSQVTQVVNIALSCITTVCLAVWIVFLNREGETRLFRILRRPAPQDEEMLVEHLAAINSTLLRAARK